MPRPEPDFDRLREIAKSIEALQASGGWNEQRFLEATKAATEAAPDFNMATEFVLNEAEPAWITHLEQATGG